MEQNIEQTNKLRRLYGFILAFCIVNASVVIFFYGILYKEDQIASKYRQRYETNLLNYTKKYQQNEQLFFNFSFYQNFDRLLFTNQSLNQYYKERISQFANVTQKQFYNLYELIRKIAIDKQFGQISKFLYNYTDWSKKNAPIRDERGFNSSFIFAALTSIQYRINKNTTQEWISLSAQEIIDCCPQCMKAKKPEKVFQYIIENGILTQKEYSYLNSRFDTTSKTCQRNNRQGKKYIKGYKKVKNCEALEKQIGVGTIVVGLDGRNFPMYKYGIFSQCQRKATHYAVIVALGFDHYKVQNSWGDKWGQRGFIRIGPGDTCGICLNGLVPIIIL